MAQNSIYMGIGKRRINLIKVFTQQFLFYFLFLKSCYLTKKGTCLCNANYGAYDCSINLSAKPLLLQTTYANNMFDISNQTLTDILLVVGKFLADNDKATLKCDLLIVSDLKNTDIRKTFRKLY